MDTQKSLQWIVGIILIIVGEGFSNRTIPARICDLKGIESARL
jgi:hypothetical protein